MVRTGAATGNEHQHWRLYNTAGQVGSISTNGSATSFNESSDYRLKENETPIIDGIARVKQLKPYKFNFKADADTTLDGETMRQEAMTEKEFLVSQLSQ